MIQIRRIQSLPRAGIGTVMLVSKGLILWAIAVVFASLLTSVTAFMVWHSGDAQI